MHYRCLVLDHDDTVVRSAETVNYPALVEKLRRDHPDRSITFREFMLEVFDRTFTGMCQDFLHLTPEETQEQFEFWKVYVRTHIPPAYEGMDALLHDFRAQGGLVCVSSHSGWENITRDYQRDFGFTPDRIYSFELPPEQRKPSPFALEDIMRRYSLRPQELLMVDDMRTGLDMAARRRRPLRLRRLVAHRAGDRRLHAPKLLVLSALGRRAAGACFRRLRH